MKILDRIKKALGYTTETFSLEAHEFTADYSAPGREVVYRKGEVDYFLKLPNTGMCHSTNIADIARNIRNARIGRKLNFNVSQESKERIASDPYFGSVSFVRELTQEERRRLESLLKN